MESFISSEVIEKDLRDLQDEENREENPYLTTERPLITLPGLEKLSPPDSAKRRKSIFSSPKIPRRSPRMETSISKNSKMRFLQKKVLLMKKR